MIPSFDLAHLSRITVMVCGILTLSSCNKIDQLKAEAATLEARRQVVFEQTQGYEQRMRTLNANDLVAKAPTILNKAKAELAEAARLETEAREKLAKWTEAETAMNALKDKVAAYKAKHTK